MERALKERIIGAVVLVTLVVLVVPVFLDGPPATVEVRSERVPLPGQDAQKTQTVVLERNRDEPVPAQPGAAMPGAAEPAPVRAATASDAAPEATAGRVAATQAAEEPPAASLKPAPATREPAPAETAPARPADVAPASASPTGMFAVQLGSFSNKANAESLAAELRKQGFAAFLSEVDAGSAPLHRVRVGPQKDRPAAEAMAARLARAGHEGQVVPHP